MSGSEDEIRRKKSRSRSRSGSKSGSGSEEEEEYEVEDIRDKKFRNGQWEYLIKWVGWESDTNTWEPKEHLDDCPDKLEEFEKKWKRKQEKKEKRKKEERERMLKEMAEREKRRDERLEKRKLASSDSDSEPDEKPAKQKREAEPKEKPERRDSEDKRKPDRRESDDKRKEEKKKAKKPESELFKVNKPAREEKKEKAREEKKEGKFVRDLPVKILGMTKEPGEPYFVVRLKSDEIGLMKQAEAHDLVPKLCCKFYSQNISFS